MTEFQRLFLVQARSDLLVFELLRRTPTLPACHALHYLQMATEMLGKAYAWKHGPRSNTHRAFVGFLRSLSTNRQAQRQLGFEGRNENWVHLIRKSVPLAERVEDLAPALSPDAPNPEYPWPHDAPEFAPAEYVFGVWQELQETAAGRQFLNLTASLFAAADAFL
jgi:hypothetical protein